MNDADNLAMLGRIMGGLIVVLVLLGLLARVARRAHGNKSTSGLRVIDRIGLSREANLTVVGVANRVLLLGVTAQGVTMLANLDAGAAETFELGSNPKRGTEVDAATERDVEHPGGVAGSGVHLVRDEDDQEHSRRAMRMAREQTLANPDRGIIKDRILTAAEPRSQRRPVPTGVALEEYPDLASALRAAGRTSGSSSTAHPSSHVITTTGEGASAPQSAAAPGPPAPRTRAQARAEARATAAAVAAAQSTAQSTQAPANFAPVDRIPVQRSQSEPGDSKRVVPGPTGQASGSVLSPRTWRQGIEALRDLTVRRG